MHFCWCFKDYVSVKYAHLSLYLNFFVRFSVSIAHSRFKVLHIVYDNNGVHIIGKRSKSLKRLLL